MSKFVKDLVTTQLRGELGGVNDALLVNVVGMDAVRTTKLRKDLRGKNIRLRVIKNSLAARACEGTPLAAAFNNSEGTLALIWGGEDIVSLAKEVKRLSELKEFAGFEPRGGAMDGAPLTAAEVKTVSTWPSRAEQLGILLGQVLSPGSVLAVQLIGMGGALASQIKQRIEDLEKVAGDAPDVATAEGATAEGEAVDSIAKGVAVDSDAQGAVVDSGAQGAVVDSSAKGAVVESIAGTPAAEPGAGPEASGGEPAPPGTVTP